MSHPDVLIVGGGLAGAIAAIHLVRGGASVTLLEKSTSPHDKVCGEFLSGEALGELRRVGIDPLTFGAVPLTQVTIAAGHRHAQADLPFEALSLTRRHLDEALLDLAQESGVHVRRGATVRDVTVDDGAATALLKTGEDVHAHALFLATGKHDLKQQKRPRSLHDDMIGMKTYLRLSADAERILGQSVDVVFFKGGYCGFQKVEGGRVNACMAIAARDFSALGGDLPSVFEAMGASSSRAASLLNDAEALLDKPLAVGRVPYGYVRQSTDGPYHIGDQATVIPSFCGEGMGLALRSGRLAAEAYLNGVSAKDFQSSFARLAAPRVKASALLSRALTHRTVQSFAARTAQVAPALVSRIAALTRTPDEALAS